MNNGLITLFALLFTSQIAFSQKTVSGYVNDAETGEPLIGANILVSDFNTGTTTDFDGSYSVSIPADANTLIVSYTGYETVTKEIGDATVIDILLTSGRRLDEVIVIGYGTVQKSDKTGAIESIKPEDEEVMQYDNFQNYLQGRAKGVQILSNGNELLSPSSIRIRGSNSLRGDNEPLFVVDGIIINSSTEDVADPLSGGSSYLSAQNGLTGINPQDIESIEILKDASATAIYGSRGSNGVVLITTKKGRSEKPKINYKGTTRIGKATRLYEVLNPGDFVAYIDEYRLGQQWDPNYYTYADGSIADFENSAEFMEANTDSIPRLNGIDWYEDILETSVAHNHRISIAGGKESSSYYVGLGFGDAKGVIPGTRLRQGDILFKSSHKIGNRLEVSPRISTNYSLNNSSKGTENLGSSNGSLVRHIVEAIPFEEVEDNNVDQDPDDNNDGPRAWIADYDDDATEFRSLAALTLDYKISEVFTYRILGGLDYRNKNRKLWYGNTINRGKQANGEAGIGTLNRVRYNVDNTLRFNKRFNKNHRINGTAGVVFDEIFLEQSSMSATNFSNHDLRYDGISFGQSFLAPQFFKSQETIVSLLGRINYTLKSKYLFTASFRRDGSSKFSKDNRWSFFPSAAFAWKLIEESFFAKSKVWSDAKLRIGYGRTGSQAIRPYQTFSRYTPTANLLSTGNGGSVTAVLPQNVGNPNLTWETTDQFNVGFDFGLLNDRFTGSIDAYHKNTLDLLQVLNIGPSAGFETIFTNEGSLQNKGIELGLNAHILEGAFKWEVFGTFSINRNKIIDLGVPEAQFGNEIRKAILGDQVSGGTIFKVPANIYIEGEQAGLFWGYETQGIVQTNNDLMNAPAVQGVATQLGDVYYVDQNGDGNITELDLTIIGNPNPKYYFGLGSDFSYKNFSLNFFFNGVQGQDIANGNLGRQDIPTALNNNIRSEAYAGAWREGSTSATHPRLGYDIKGDFTDRMVEDGSFIRLSFVSLGYSIPSGKIKGIDQARIFISGHNLLLITKYSGFDPEVNSFSFDPTRQGIDWNSFPNQKAISVGINIGL